MALVSRHYKVVEAVYGALGADTDLALAIAKTSWRISKAPWHQYMSWEPGLHFVPVRLELPSHETRMLRWIFGVLIVGVWPSDKELAVGLEARLAFQERIVERLGHKARNDAPSQLTDLTSAFLPSDPNWFAFDKVELQIGDPFIESIFKNGYDAFATLARVFCTSKKQDFS